MIAALFAKPAFKIGLGVLILLVVIGLALWWRSAKKADDRTNRDIGAGNAVIEGQRQTLDQLKDANNAEQDLRAGDERSAARFAECLQNARTKSRCDRFRPIPD